ncbi:MAG: DNA starvation/stationary phase protection protein Dps [Thermoflexales bacterium]|nr:DNA starvation/stationary phase protection protein Dps [Thermoflexales bacterium]MDW8350910.1 DNA starvation/stationary phase protection protein Dps [Anaerolineae bacterium]
MSNLETTIEQKGARNGALATFDTRHDLPAAVRGQMIALLNQQLADTFDLMSQTKQAHWNVKGPQFIALHKMFDEFAEGLEGYVDDIAERITALGGYAAGTLRMAAKASTLPDYPTDVVADMDHVRALADRYAALAASTRKAIDVATDAGDQDTADLFIEVSRDLDKWLWFLEAHIQA